jgi:hypothetical protein
VSTVEFLARREGGCSSAKTGKSKAAAVVRVNWGLESRVVEICKGEVSTMTQDHDFVEQETRGLGELVEGSSSSACEDSERFKSVRALSYGGQKRVLKLELVKTDPVNTVEV